MLKALFTSQFVLCKDCIDTKMSIRKRDAKVLTLKYNYGGHASRKPLSDLGLFFGLFRLSTMNVVLWLSHGSIISQVMTACLGGGSRKLKGCQSCHHIWMRARPRPGKAKKGEKPPKLRTIQQTCSVPHCVYLNA